MSYVVVGAGLAGAKAVQTLREEGFTGDIHLVGEEAERPYERPPLSKGFLIGKQPIDSVFVHQAHWYTENRVDLHLGTRVVGLDAETKQLAFESGETLSFDKLLLTTGASPRRINTPGSDLEGVHYLRRIGDSQALLREFSGGNSNVVVIGGGWIGLEVAAAARGYGNGVTVVEPQRAVLNAALGSELGGMFTDLHRENGVNLLLGDGVDAIDGSEGRVKSITTRSGQTLAADAVVVGVGARPNVELAMSAKLDVDNGVLVDEFLCTAHPDIYAAGDVANAMHPTLGRRLRVEHWANALHGGPAAARSMLGQRTPYDRVPYFYTDQYDLGMEYSGDVGPEGHDRIVYRGDRSTRAFIAFWIKDCRVLAGMNVNVWDVTSDIQSLIRSGRQVDLDKLADPSCPLADV